MITKGLCFDQFFKCLALMQCTQRSELFRGLLLTYILYFLDNFHKRAGIYVMGHAVYPCWDISIDVSCFKRVASQDEGLLLWKGKQR